MRVNRIIVPIALAALAVTACGSSKASNASYGGGGSAAPTTVTPTTAAPTTAAPATAAGTSAPMTAPATGATTAPAGSAASSASGPETISLHDTAIGKVLADGDGMTIYLFTKDTNGSGKSVCAGGCSAAWPPVLTSGAPVAASGLDASKLGTITRDGGGTQVTYAGWPLYYYSKDKQAGDVNGENVGGVWFAVGADGKAVQASTPNY